LKKKLNESKIKVGHILKGGVFMRNKKAKFNKKINAFMGKSETVIAKRIKKCETIDIENNDFTHHEFILMYINKLNSIIENINERVESGELKGKDGGMVEDLADERDYLKHAYCIEKLVEKGRKMKLKDKEIVNTIVSNERFFVNLKKNERNHVAKFITAFDKVTPLELNIEDALINLNNVAINYNVNIENQKAFNGETIKGTSNSPQRKNYRGARNVWSDVTINIGKVAKKYVKGIVNHELIHCVFYSFMNNKDNVVQNCLATTELREKGQFTEKYGLAEEGIVSFYEEQVNKKMGIKFKNAGTYEIAKKHVRGYSDDIAEVSQDKELLDKIEENINAELEEKGYFIDIPEVSEENMAIKFEDNEAENEDVELKGVVYEK